VIELPSKQREAAYSPVSSKKSRGGAATAFEMAQRRRAIQGVLIFRRGTAPYRSPMNWLDLTTCEIQIYDGTCEHTDLTKEPYLSMWAARLKESLDGVALR
jgi:hypothetical protein